MRAAAWMAIGMGVLAGCSAPRSTGVAPLADGSYRVTVAGRNLGGATQQALNEAAVHCGGRGGQAQMLRRQINAADYDLIFRCANSGAPLRPGEAPILLGGAVPAMAPQIRPTVLPAEPPTLAALSAAAVPLASRSSLPPVPELPPLRPFSVADAGPVFAPLPEMSPRPPAPRGYESLPPVTGMPGGPPARSLTPLAAISEPPQRLGAASSTPPAGFWDMRRN